MGNNAVLPKIPFHPQQPSFVEQVKAAYMVGTISTDQLDNHLEAALKLEAACERRFDPEPTGRYLDGWASGLPELPRYLKSPRGLTLRGDPSVWPYDIRRDLLLPSPVKSSTW